MWVLVTSHVEGSQRPRLSAKERKKGKKKIIPEYICPIPVFPDCMEKHSLFLFSSLMKCFSMCKATKIELFFFNFPENHFLKKDENHFSRAPNSNVIQTHLEGMFVMPTRKRNPLSRFFTGNDFPRHYEKISCFCHLSLLK